MGFRQGAYARVWEVTPVSDACTKLRMSVSRKNKATNEYEQDFSGFVMVVGAAAAKQALSLEANSNIRIGDCDVSTKWDPDKKVTYTNFKMFSFEVDGAPKSSGGFASSEDNMMKGVDDGEPVVSHDLPF